MNTIQRDGDISEVVATYSFLPNELIVFMNKGATRENMGRNLIVFANLKFKALTTAIEHLLIFVQPVIFSIIAIILLFYILVSYCQSIIHSKEFINENFKEKTIRLHLARNVNRLIYY